MAELEDIRSMPASELAEEANALRKELFELRMKIMTDAGALARYRKARKELAQVLTVKTQKESEAA